MQQFARPWHMGCAQYILAIMTSLMRFFDWLIPVGPRSVLFGAHCFFLHPLFVAEAWRQLYGFPWDYRLWVCFFVHDLGYLFYWCRNIDSDDGERHVEWGANIVKMLFGESWQMFCLRHSRFYSRKLELLPSQLCYADKYSIVITPWWLYVPMATLTGEIREYMNSSHHEIGGKYHDLVEISSRKIWFLRLQEYLRQWIGENILKQLDFTLNNH